MAIALNIRKQCKVTWFKSATKRMQLKKKKKKKTLALYQFEVKQGEKLINKY